MKAFIRQHVVIIIILGTVGFLLATAVFLRYAQNIAFLRYARPQADALPQNRPENCTPKQPQQKRAVFLGDSITMGTVSVNYVDLLAEQLDSDKIDLVNAGINSQLAYNVLLRVDEVLQCDPDFVFVLIGTNDLNAVALEGNANGYVQGQKLPQTPSPAWYRENLTAIATQLNAQSTAQIFLISPPPLGEQPDSAAYQLSAEYSQIVQAVAQDTAVTYLPLHETMDTYLRQQPGERRAYDENWNKLIVDGMQRHFLYRQSLDKIAQRNGFLLLTDSMHLNTTGATMIVDLVHPILEAE